jgi:hypothetical protein
MRVIGRIYDFNSNHHLRGGFRCELHVVARREATVGLQHFASFRFAFTDTHFFPFAGCNVFLPDSEFLPAQPSFAAAARLRPPLRRCSALVLVIGPVVIAFLLQCFHQPSCFFALVAQRLFPVKRLLAGHGMHLRAILISVRRSINPSSFHHGQHAGEQFTEFLLLTGSKVRQCVVIHRLVCAEPPQSRLIAHHPLYCRAELIPWL